MKVGNEPDDENASPSAIRKNLDLSLKRLAIDCIDIYYLHRPDPVTPLAETLGALDEAMRAGKIRHYAVSNYTRDQFADLLAVADRNHLPRPVAHEPELSMLRPERAADLLPFCAQEHIAVFPYRVLHGGLLTGKYALGQPPPPGSRKAERDAWLGPLDDALFARLDVIGREAKEVGQSMAEFAIRWALRQPAVLSVIIGAKRIEQLDDAIGAVNWRQHVAGSKGITW
jgi:aryl-alcohol dehydrogenase-like predicted oxidoreductase